MSGLAKRSFGLCGLRETARSWPGTDSVTCTSNRLPVWCPLWSFSTETPLQVHDEADCYAVKDAQVAAWFCWGNGARRHLPAAVWRPVGEGAAAMIAFDLAKARAWLLLGLVLVTDYQTAHPGGSTTTVTTPATPATPAAPGSPAAPQE